MKVKMYLAGRKIEADDVDWCVTNPQSQQSQVSSFGFSVIFYYIYAAVFLFQWMYIYR